MGKRAIVLAGGGSRGAYQIGVWKALRELGIDYDIVTGSSVGALNGALMVQEDFEAGLELWENISVKDVMSDVLTDENLAEKSERQIWSNFIKNVLAQGGADVSPLENTLRKHLNEEKFRSSRIDYALVTVEYPSFKPLELTKEEIPKGEVCDYLLASSAFFPAFKLKDINGVKHLDGGYYDNLPINLAYKMGADEIIAVDLHSFGMKRKSNFPKENIRIISSQWNLGAFIYFEKNIARRNIALGYLDTLKSFGKLCGWRYAFTHEDCEKNAENLIPKIAEFTFEARMNNLLLVNKLESNLYKKLVRNFYDLGIEEKEIKIDKIFLVMLEYAAEIFKISPTEIQDISKLNKNILEKFEKIKNETDFSLKGIASIQKLIDELKSYDRSLITVYLYEQIPQIFEKNGKAKNLSLFVTAFAEEFLAAIYIYLIEKE